MLILRDLNQDANINYVVFQFMSAAEHEQRNTQLVTYIREVSDLLLDNNFSLNEQMLTSVIRSKTLNTLR
jgi:hypothetical protein